MQKHCVLVLTFSLFLGLNQVSSHAAVRGVSNARETSAGIVGAIGPISHAVAGDTYILRASSTGSAGSTTLSH